MTDEDHEKPGTAEPARWRKAGCGIRFEEDELQEGIDFSKAREYKPDSDIEPDIEPQSGQ